MKYRLFLFILLLGVLALSAPAFAQDEIELDFYYPAAVSGPLQEAFERYAAGFSADHPNVSINVVFTGSYGQTREAVRTEIEGGGAGPDVAVMLSVDLYSFIEDGTIISAQQFIDQLDDPAAFVDDFSPLSCSIAWTLTVMCGRCPSSAARPSSTTTKSISPKSGSTPNSHRATSTS